MLNDIALSDVMQDAKGRIISAVVKLNFEEQTANKSKSKTKTSTKKSTAKAVKSKSSTQTSAASIRASSYDKATRK